MLQVPAGLGHSAITNDGRCRTLQMSSQLLIAITDFLSCDTKKGPLLLSETVLLLLIKKHN